jgi:hypothetical protein
MEIKVPQNCFHKWYILIRYYQDIQKSTISLGREFYSLYYDCWLFEKSDTDILDLTIYFLRNNELEHILTTKNFYWELANKEKNWPDGEKWIWMYNSIQEMLSKESKEIRNFFKKEYAKEEIEYKLWDWNDELFD